MAPKRSGEDDPGESHTYGSIRSAHSTDTGAESRSGPPITDGGAATRAPPARSVGESVGDAVEVLVSEKAHRPQPIILLNPSQATLRQVISLLWSLGPELVEDPRLLLPEGGQAGGVDDRPPLIQVVAGEYCLDSVLSDPGTGLRAADLAGGGIEFTKATVECPGPLLVTPDYGIGFIKIGGAISQLAVPNTETEALYEAASSLANQAPRFEAPLPGWETIRDTFEAEFGERSAAFFRQLIVSGEAIDVVPSPLGLEGAALVTACITELPLEDVRRWASEIGITSKSEFEQVRTQLFGDSALEQTTDVSSAADETVVGSLAVDEAWGWNLKPDGEWDHETVAEYAARNLMS